VTRRHHRKPTNGLNAARIAIAVQQEEERAVRHPADRGRQQRMRMGTIRREFVSG
jgi:hypothetical protein